MIIFLDKILNIDRKIYQSLVAYNLPWLSATLGVLTYLGTGGVWIAAYAAFFVFLPDYFAPLIWASVISEIVGLFIIIILRYITKRERPTVPHKYFFLTPWNRFSFPSHHAYRATILLVIFGAAFPGLLWLLIVLAATVCFSRLYLAKHYFSDVLTGIFLGIILATACQRIVHFGPFKCLTN